MAGCVFQTCLLQGKWPKSCKKCCQVQKLMNSFACAPTTHSCHVYTHAQNVWEVFCSTSGTVVLTPDLGMMSTMERDVVACCVVNSLIYLETIDHKSAVFLWNVLATWKTAKKVSKANRILYT